MQNAFKYLPLKKQQTNAKIGKVIFKFLPRTRTVSGVTVIGAGVHIYIGECGSTLSVGLAHAVPPTNTKFKPLLLLTQAGKPYRNTCKHRTSYFKSALTFLGPAKIRKSISAAQQKPEILDYQYNR